ncbi:3-keto-disaccharide hydrolase [Parvularcula dongshanensis]|uniref:3-keto-alpha-glucoside-1,2-lyase/3-keto-2-hydroxy-glucal hydratase domain-containing protein n=1 Tax=Parvularcula dongshanensis TaxID=1173995 RepID=A0A840I077_9PROT|nr:DUF1080 domain-containing protein [Parvularcula dongshanensis]MBB4658476.1 hypothetical protein [Parvularcula dongshanensis]
MTPMITALVLLAAQPGWRPLLSEDLADWNVYLSYRHGSDYDGSVPRNADGTPIEPVGLNPPDQDVFVVETVNGESVLHVSGEVYGMAFTDEVFENYRLRMQVRWGEVVWPPREALLKDTGLLYHSVGEPGADYWRTWMRSQEFQIMEGHVGDYWTQAGSAFDLRGLPREGVMSPVASMRHGWVEIAEGSAAGNFAMRSHDAESPTGEWTQIELIVFGDRAVHVVNGEPVMVLKGSRYTAEDGEVRPLTSGRLQIQSEAAEVFFRRIEVMPIDAMPEAYVPLFE